MSDQKQPVLFVSHHSSKLQTAMHVERALNSKGVKCWVAPRDVEPGEPFDRAVRKAIADTDAMLLLFCSKSEKSRHVKRELILADQLGKAIIPLRLERIDPGELSYHLADSQWIDWLEQRDDVVDRVAAKAREFRDQQSTMEPSGPGGTDIDLASPPTFGSSAPPQPGIDVEDSAPAHSEAVGAAADLQPHALGAFAGPGGPGFAPAPPPAHGDPAYAAPPRKKKSLLWLWILLAVLVLAGGGGLTWWLMTRDQGISESWFAGEWSDSRQCTQVFRFEDNGDLVIPDGQRGRWSIEDGDTLVVEANDRTDRRRIERVSDDEVDSDEGTIYRCD